MRKDAAFVCTSRHTHWCRFRLSRGLMDSDDNVMTLKYSSYHYHSLLLRLHAQCKGVAGLEESTFGFSARILQNLYGGPNVVKLLDVVRDPQSKTPSLVGHLVCKCTNVVCSTNAYSIFLYLSYMMTAYLRASDDEVCEERDGIDLKLQNPTCVFCWSLKVASVHQDIRVHQQHGLQAAVSNAHRPRH